MPDCLRYTNVVKLQIRHQVKDIEVIFSSMSLWKGLYVYKAREKFSFSEVWGQKIVKVFSILV